MSTPQPPPAPPAAEAPAQEMSLDDASAEASSWLKLGGIGMAVVGILISLYFLAFHVGAAVLSYQKFGSFLWAILDFFFPYFYYPYYAFALSGPSAAPTEMVGGAVRRRGVVRSRKMGFKRL